MHVGLAFTAREEGGRGVPGSAGKPIPGRKLALEWLERLEGHRMRRSPSRVQSQDPAAVSSDKDRGFPPLGNLPRIVQGKAQGGD